MSTPSTFPFLGGLDLFFDDLILNQISDFLETNADELSSARKGMSELNAAALGTAPAASDLGIHSAKAREHVLDALKEMAAGLRGYQDIILALKNEAGSVDGVTVQNSQTILAQSDACIAPDFANTGQCTLPTDGDS